MSPFLTLFALICLGDEAQVVSLINDGTNLIETKNVDGFAPLHFAAGAGKLWYFFIFWNSYGWTCIFAFLQGLENITQILIDNRANVNIRSDEGRTPLEIAVVNGDL